MPVDLIARFRIVPGFHAHGRRLFYADRIRGDLIGGFVDLGPNRKMKTRSWYRPDQLDPLDDAAKRLLERASRS